MKFKKAGLILGSLALAVCLSSCGSNESDKGNEKESVSVEDTMLKSSDLNDSVQIIDIRHPDKFLGWKNEDGVSGHIANAVDFPVEWLSYEKKPENIETELKRRHIDKDKKTVIYSDKDVEKEDFDKFAKLGFKDIHSLEGGIDSYAKDGGKLERLEGYEMYVSPEWVEDLVNGKKPEGYNGEKYKIVEISLPSEKDEYKNGHIKGAINFNSDEINHVPGPRTVQEYEGIPVEKQITFWNFYPDDKIKEVLENAGIDKDTTVILYGTDKATTAAARAGLVMDYAGVKNIKFINGGKVLWNLEKRPLDKEDVKTKKVDFGTSVPQNPSIIFNYEDEKKIANDPKNSVVASVRSFDEYLGKMSGYTYIDKAGDIKNARFAYAGSNPYAMEDFRNIDNTMFNYNLCADRWKKWGITPEKKVSFHCGTGWRAAETYYIAKALGWKDVGVYEGGWYEWSKMPDSEDKEKGLPEDAPEKKPEEYFTKQ